MTENPIEHEGLRVEALERMFGSGEIIEISEDNIEVIRRLIEGRLVEGVELVPRVWSSKYSENRGSLVQMFGEEAIVSLESLSIEICPEPGKIQDKSTKAKGTRLPKFLQDLVRLAAGEGNMTPERFVERTQTRMRFHQEREEGKHKGKVLNPTPISAKGAKAVIGWLRQGS